MEGFNYLDIVVVVLIVLLGFKGFLNGFLKELFTLVGVIGGIFIASRYSYEIGKVLNDTVFAFDSEAGMNFAGFLVGILGFWLGTTLIRMTIEKMSSDTPLSAINKILGIIVGSGKMFFIFAVITHAVSNIEVINKNLGEFTKDSHMYPLLKETGAYIIKISPDDFKKKETISEKADNLVESAKDLANEATKEIEKATKNIQ
jgi:membrane protein required for colicin V production